MFDTVCRCAMNRDNVDNFLVGYTEYYAGTTANFVESQKNIRKIHRIRRIFKSQSACQNFDLWIFFRSPKYLHRVCIHVNKMNNLVFVGGNLWHKPLNLFYTLYKKASFLIFINKYIKNEWYLIKKLLKFFGFWVQSRYKLD